MRRSPSTKPKIVTAPREEIVIARQMHQALVLHFLEGLTQAQIADQLGISHATVNRLIKRGRQLGLVEIKIKSPVEPLVDMEERLLALGGISRAVVVPTVSDNPQTALQAVGEAAARLLLEDIADGDTICITGGKGVSAVVAGLQAPRRFDVEVDPGDGLRSGQALYRRQPCLDADGRPAWRPLLPDPCAALCRQRRRAGHADQHALRRRCLQTGAGGEGCGGRHRLDPVGRFELLRPASVLEHRPRGDRAFRRIVRTAGASAR